MPDPRLRPAVLRYGIALAAVLFAFAVRWSIAVPLGALAVYTTFYLAITGAAYYGGFGAGLFATATATLLSFKFLEAPEAAEWLSLSLFVLNGTIISLIIQKLQASRGTVTEQLEQMEEQAARLLAANEERRRLVESIGDAFYLIDPDWRIVYLNESAVRYANRPRAEAEGRNFWEVFPLPADKSFEDALRAAVTSGETAHCDLYHERTGEWLQAAVSPTHGGGCCLFLRDITERKRAEERTSKRNELLRMLSSTAEQLLGAEDSNQVARSAFEVAKDALQLDLYVHLLTDPGGSDLRLASSEGLPPEFLVGLTHADLRNSLSGRAAETRTPQVAERIQESKDPYLAFGRKLGIHCFVCNPLLAGERLLGTLAFASRRRDSFDEDELEFLRTVSHYVEICLERLKLVRALSDQAALLDFASDAILAASPDGTIEFWNRGAEAMYGWSASEALGRVSHELLATRFAPPKAEILQAIAERGGWEGELTHRRRNGTEVVVSSRWAPRLVDGAMRGFLEINRDVTERKLLEEKLRQTAKLESLGVLAGGIAHDFNNLLVGVMGNASLAADSLPSSHPAQPVIEQVIRAAERAADLTRQMLAYAGKGRFVIQRVNLSELVSEIASLVHAAIPKNVQLRLNLAPNLPAVEADVAQLQQIVMNLVINGAESIGQEQGAVLVTTSAQDVDEQYLKALAAGSSAAPGRYVSLEVQDSGCGMDEGTQARIFDPFFSTKFQGRGLGLSAVLGIVRSHGGALKVYSTPGKGSSFKILFPAAASRNLGAELPAKSPLEELHGTGTVLVVDDEPVVRQAAMLTLQRYGYTALAAANGREALDVVRQHNGEISLVLLDLTMPLMDGEETLRHMRQIEPDLQVILSSGFNEVEAVRRFSGKGLAGFLQKPYTAGSLALKVKSVLGESGHAGATPI
jgi:PAS domain S-box-containing protein